MNLYSNQKPIMSELSPFLISSDESRNKIGTSRKKKRYNPFD